MVQWKDKLEGEVGTKAENLEKLEGFKIPNFFVITPRECKRLFKGSETAEEVLNTSLDSKKKEEIKNAYKEIGMSSEVRTATGKAKNLVGGQRNGQRVSVRISDHGQGDYEYRLNVGSSEIFNALKDVAASYYRNRDDHPSIIVQKMVEPEYTGAVINDYPDRSIVEVVEGLGHSLEEGLTKPFIYFLREDLEDVFVPEKHLKVTRNPINGDKRRKKINTPNKPFSERKIVEFYRKVRDNNASIKFVYKRGSFHVVDVWRAEDNLIQEDEGLEGLKVSPGNISGVLGRDITHSETTLPPEKYGKILVSEKGGYTSTDAQKARRENKTAVFSYYGDIEHENFGHANNTERNPFSTKEEVKPVEQITGTEVVPLNPQRGKGVYTRPPFGEGYSVSRRDIPENSYLETCADVFCFNGEKAVLDTRRIDRKAIENVMEYLDAELKIVIFENPEISEVVKAVEQGFDVFTAEEKFLDDLRGKVSRAERKFILEKVRDISN